MVEKDLVIVGGGPAGLAASIYAARALLDAVTLEKEAVGGQVITTSEVDNYPGVPHADGYSLIEAMRQQAEGLGARIVMDPVSAIERNAENGRFTVVAANETYDAAAVVYSAGAKPRKAGFAGEEAFTGRGVSYCATCDGMFYRNKLVFVVGGGNTAAEEALFLSRFASKVVLVVRKPFLRADASLQRELAENAKIELRLQTKVVSVGGKNLLQSIEFEDTASGETFTESHDEGSFGVFVAVGRDPESSLVANVAQIASDGSVFADERMATSTSGLFVAGDVRSKPLRQIITAAADGAVAAMSAAEYLRETAKN